MEIEYHGRRMPIVKKFHIFRTEEFRQSEKELMSDGKGYIFILFSMENDEKIKAVKVIGVTTSRSKLIANLASVDETHLGYIMYNGNYDKPLLDEYLILEFQPKEIWFLDKELKLLYTAQRQL